MILNGSHLVIATGDVARMAKFFESVFQIEPHFSHVDFLEFVLPGKFRIAFFKPVGKAAKYFHAESDRRGVSFGVTAKAIESIYERANSLGLETSGPPKEHPWGEKSFLLIDPDGNRWEVTESPSDDGMLVNR